MVSQGDGCRVDSNISVHLVDSLSSCRDETFRKEFSKIGEVRSIIPDHVNVMALTATATKRTRKYVCKKLSMSAPVVISQSPNKENIKYIVCLKEGTIPDVMAPLVDEVKAKRVAMPRVIIFANTYEAYSEIYLHFKRRLGRVDRTSGCSK